MSTILVLVQDSMEQEGILQPAQQQTIDGSHVRVYRARGRRFERARACTRLHTPTPFWRFRL